MDRREFMVTAAGGMLVMMAGDLGAATTEARKSGKAVVSLVKDADRNAAIKKAVQLLGINPVKGQDVLLKPNFNTADPFPASTHNDTLVSLFGQLKEMGAKSITIGERCGPPDTADVLRQKGIYKLCKEHDVGLVNFEELPAEEWVRVRPEGSHWRDGFNVAKPVLDSACTVSTCCLKTHQYGGVFTMSLKLSVGITHKHDMSELHGSARHMRRMIAEINQAYSPSLILMDGMEVFTDGGPSHGTVKKAGVMIAGTDRIAVDAVGLAVLKEMGSNSDIMDRKIFDQEQIVRAVDLGIGVGSSKDIAIVTVDEAGRQYAAKLNSILAQG